MRSNTYLMEICMDIYRHMYRESNPPADFDKLMVDGTTMKKDWFMVYYLPQERQIEILEEHLKKHRCNRHERKQIEFEIWLGSSPNSVEKKGVD